LLPASGEQAATALGTGAIRPELPQTPPPFVGPPPPSALILVGLCARCCWVGEGSLLAMIEMDRARCGQHMTGISRKRLSEQRLFGGGVLQSMTILTEKFRALMAAKP
jgi:hypothetical protein